MGIGGVKEDQLSMLQSSAFGRSLVALAIAGAGVLALLAPVGAAYYRARASYHHVRPTDEIVANSADLHSYLVGKRSIGVWGWLPTAQARTQRAMQLVGDAGCRPDEQEQGGRESPAPAPQ